MRTDLHRAAHASEVMVALLDFEQTPGRYPVAMREPRILFDQAGVVLMLAAGRPLEGGASVAQGVRQAACFFVRTVMLRPGVDHYTLLGLPQTFDAEQLREHYRLMIRMTHPDFAASGAAWPADAAARINQAHDVLASGVKREDYRVALDGARAKPKAPGMATHGLRPRTRAGAARRNWPMIRAMGVAAGVVLLALTALIMSWPSSEEGLLTVAVRAPRVLPAAAQPDQPDQAAVAIAPAPKPVPVPEPDPPLQAIFAKKLPVVTTPQVQQSPALAVVQMVERVERVEHEVAVPPVVAMAPATPVVQLPIEPPPAVMAPEVQAPRITLEQVQPMLTNVLQSLQSGQGEQVLQWLERSSRQSEAASRFAAAYNQSLAGSRVTGLGPVRLTARFAGGELVVDGMVQLWLQDASQQAGKQDFRLRAYFLSRDSGPVLARLEAY